MTPSRIVFVAAPPSLREEFRLRAGHHDEHGHPGHHHGLGETDGDTQKFDPEIPLPVETQGEEEFNPEDLSWEMILSGMIRVVTEPGGDYPVEVEPGWVDYYRRFVIALRPDLYNEFGGAALIKARNGDFAMALEIITALEALYPGDGGVLLNRALILEDRAAALEDSPGEGGEAGVEAAWGEALGAYEKALEAAQTGIPLPGAFFNAGLFFVRRRDYGRGRECLAAYLAFTGEDDDGSREDEDDDESLEAEAGELHEKRKRAAELVKDIESRGLDDPDFTAAAALVRTGNAGGALERIHAFLEKRPQVWNGWFLLGWALRKQGRWRDSLASFRQAAELGAGGTDLRNETAICLMELGDLDGARRELLGALREDPENGKIISNLGVLALKRGDREEAAGFFRALEEVDPGDPLARHWRDL